MTVSVPSEFGLTGLTGLMGAVVGEACGVVELPPPQFARVMVDSSDNAISARAILLLRIICILRDEEVGGLSVCF